MTDDNFRDNGIPIDLQSRTAEDLNKAIEKPELGEDIVIVNEKLKELQEQKIAAEQQVAEEKKESVVTVPEALNATRVLEQHSSRGEVRLLIITKDRSVLVEGSASQTHIFELSSMFAEIHVVIITDKRDGLIKNSRLTDNVWFYPTDSRYWWKAPYDAYRIANEQLNFAQGFRPDIVIAEDPFESGVAAYFLADRHKRPLQLHITEDFYESDFVDRAPHNGWRLFMARFVLGRVDCVRTGSESVRETIVKHNPDLTPFTEILPVYYDLESWKTATPTFSLTDRYPQFRFVLLHISKMEPESHTDRVITGAMRTLTRYPAIGLVIVGDGPERENLLKQVETFGIQKQVVFEPPTTDIVSYLKTADLLLHMSEDPEEEVTIIQAAAAGIPMVLGANGLGRELFEDGESAYICPNDSSPCISEKINTFLNGSSLRSVLSQNAENVVFGRIEQDYQTFVRAYRGSIERCLTLGN